MKRVLFLMVIALAFVACEADQDLVQLEPEKRYFLETADGSSIEIDAVEALMIARDYCQSSTDTNCWKCDNGGSCYYVDYQARDK